MWELILHIITLSSDCIVQAFMPYGKALIIMEGLIYYLRPAGVDHLFAELACLPPAGNMFLIDHVSRDMSRTFP